MMDSECLGQCLELFELMIAIMSGILGIDLFEKGSVLFNFGNLLFDGLFSVNLLDLFWLQIIFAFEISYLGQFFVEIPNLLGQCTQEGFILLIYSLCFSLL
eukprot:TRINITY_DN43347_c0_g1_i1.p1 TRINITY_DN43347_c0_g1~~TRINITY_DN43347_c0_g1_i1.p1  ORF type:complete len:101 (+),score=3.21 TRINITY_DN43347_c0_g1_i1:101-403(+)